MSGSCGLCLEFVHRWWCEPFLVSRLLLSSDNRGREGRGHVMSSSRCLWGQRGMKNEVSKQALICSIRAAADGVWLQWVQVEGEDFIQHTNPHSHTPCACLPPVLCACSNTWWYPLTQFLFSPVSFLSQSIKWNTSEGDRLTHTRETGSSG